MSHPKASQALLHEAGPGPSSAGSKQPQNSNDETRGEPSKKRKKKKKVGSKEERKLKRETDKLKELYGPKDSHIKIITPEIMKKLKEGSCRPQASIKHSFLSPGTTLSPAVHKCFHSTSLSGNRMASSVSPEDFPTLGTPDTKGKKNDVKVNSLVYKTVAEVKRNSTEGESGWEDVGDCDTNATTPCDGRDGINETVIVDGSDATENISEVIGDIPVIISKRKPSKKPMVVSISALIESKKEAQSPAVKTVEVKKKNKDKITVGNQLDSSGTGLMNRGKIRENPKPKRPSKLKKAIMRTRALRKANVTTKFLSSVTTSGENGKQNEVEVEGLEITATGENKESIIKIKKETTDEEFDTNVGSKIVDMYGHNVPINCLKEVNLPKTSVNEVKSIISAHKSKDDFTDKIKEIMKDAEEKSTKSGFTIDTINRVKMEIHSKKFRPYCDMYTSKELHGMVIELMKELHRYQDRLYHSDPVKFKTKRRYIHGLKDVASYLQINKLVTIIIAPDIELNNEKGGLDEKLEEIMALAREKNVRCIFSGNRYILGRPIRIKTPVSAIGVLDFQGAEEMHRRVVDEADKLRASYQSVFSERLQFLSISS